MVDYPKGNGQHFASEVFSEIFGRLLGAREIVFSLVHSFGGRGSPRS